jgi:CHASE2 domain-containing sensor protein
MSLPRLRRAALPLLLTSTLATAAIFGLRLAGTLQFWEWAALDKFFQLSRAEAPDRRILLVGITEADLQADGAAIALSNQRLVQLLNQIRAAQPRAIGLDLFRDRPAPSPELQQIFQDTPNLFGIGKFSGLAGDAHFGTFPPPAGLPRQQWADAGAVLDADEVQRRAVFYADTVGNSPYRTVPGLSLALAYRYLEAEGIRPSSSPDGGWLQLGGTTFYPFRNLTGGYATASDHGYQILLNWRRSAFEKVSVADVLAGKVPPSAFRERVVLIGADAPLKDRFATPLTRTEDMPRQVAGIEVHANVLSQILSAALEGRPLLQVLGGRSAAAWPRWGISAALAQTFLFLWLGSALAATPFLAGFSRSQAAACLALTNGALISLCYFAFLGGWWLPLVPGLLSLNLAAAVALIYSYVREIQEWNRTLQLQVEEQAGQLLAQRTFLELAQQTQLLSHYSLEISEALRTKVDLILSRISQFERVAAESLRQLAASPLALTELFSPQLPAPARTALGQGLTKIQGSIKELDQDLDRISLFLSLFPHLKFFFPELDQKSLILPQDLTQTILPPLREFFWSLQGIDLNEKLSVSCELTEIPVAVSRAKLSSVLMLLLLHFLPAAAALELRLSLENSTCQIEISGATWSEQVEFLCTWCQELLAGNGTVAAELSGERVRWRFHLPLDKDISLSR